MTNTTTKTTIAAKRTEYGVLISTAETSELIEKADALINLARDKGKIYEDYYDLKWQKVSCRVGRKLIGYGMVYEIYDISPDGKRVLLCCREIEGTRYGVSTVSKEYFLISKHGIGTKVEPASKAIAAKAANSTSELGEAIKIVRGVKKLKLK